MKGGWEAEIFENSIKWGRGVLIKKGIKTFLMERFSLNYSSTIIGNGNK